MLEAGGTETDTTYQGLRYRRGQCLGQKLGWRRLWGHGGEALHLGGEMCLGQIWKDNSLSTERSIPDEGTDVRKVGRSMVWPGHGGEVWMG